MRVRQVKSPKHPGATFVKVEDGTPNGRFVLKLYDNATTDEVAAVTAAVEKVNSRKVGR